MRVVAKIASLNAEWKVASVSYGFHQLTDSTGRPTSEVLSNQISISAYPEKTSDTEATEYDNTFFQWMIDGSQTYDVVIEWYESDNSDVVMKTMTATGCTCIAFNESTTGISSERSTQDITIAAGTIDMEGARYTNVWRKGLG